MSDPPEMTDGTVDVDCPYGGHEVTVPNDARMGERGICPVHLRPYEVVAVDPIRLSAVDD